MKRIALPVFMLLNLFCFAQDISLIPWPVEVKTKTGSFPLNQKVFVKHNFDSRDWGLLFPYFKSEMKKQFGISVLPATATTKADIIFTNNSTLSTRKPTYKLVVGPNAVEISGSKAEAVFSGMQTFFQLIPPLTKREGLRQTVSLPMVEITDYPRFDYRGMHLDVARHFFTVAEVKQYIDYLAYHKFNKFHWHLTDDQGWRVEIKKYPLLTSMVSKRNGTIIGNYPGTGSDNTQEGGFYTHEQIKEVVKYAAERFVEVIPEIEMPGHGCAAIAAYNWLSCFPNKESNIPANVISQKSADQIKNGNPKIVQETWGVFDDVFCAGNDSTYIFLQNVVDEVVKLFPSKYFHIGGDECPKTHWKICPKCQAKMKKFGLKDEHELQSHFVQRMEKYLNKKNKTIIGWDEILEGGLAPNAIVMSWRGEKGGIEAAQQNHRVIMTPGQPVYFDYSQTKQEDSIVIGGYNPLEKVYAYEPIPAELNLKQAEMVWGAQANVWTEYIANFKKVEYMIFPRMAALAEVLWSKKENKNFDNFKKRLPQQLKRYESWGAHYSTAIYELNSVILPTNNFTGVLWQLTSKEEHAKILLHKVDDNKMNAADSLSDYKEPLHINESCKYEAAVFGANKQIGKELTQIFSFNKATGKKITLASPIDKKYMGSGPFTLVNAAKSEKGFANAGEFLGFNGTDCELQIDLGKPVKISSVTVHSLVGTSNWIWPPASIDVFVSSSGTEFSPQGKATTFTQTNFYGNGFLKQNFASTDAQYVKVIIKNHGFIADGNSGEKNKAWLFIDEIAID